MGNYGIKIAEEGYDAKTAGLNNLVFHSEYPVLKIKESGATSITPIIDGALHTVTLHTHNLGYLPVFDCGFEYYNPTTSVKVSRYRYGSRMDQGAGTFNVYFSYVDSAKLYFRYSLAIGDGSALGIKYILYYDALP